MQYELAPPHREIFDMSRLNKFPHKKSAVAILLHEVDNEIYIPLIKRTASMSSHSLQIALPGGKQDLQDKSLEDTAIRECREEIGFDNEAILLGKLTPLYIPVSQYYVEPYVFYCPQKKPVLMANKLEVLRIILLSVSELKKMLPIKNNEEGFLSNQQKIKAPYFEIEGEIVWGATSMILNELKALIT